LALRTILTDKEPVLRKKSREVTAFNGRLHSLLDDMKETLDYAQGVGLAAPQVGILRRVFIIINPETMELTEFVNPEIVKKEGEQDYYEACLSVPGYSGLTHRPEKVWIKAYDRDGKPFELLGEEIMAIAMCHENDHLDGKLHTDIVDGELVKVDEEPEAEEKAE
jgi:peptide deformylase